MRLNINTDVKQFVIPCWPDCTISLSHVGQRDTQQAIMGAEIRKASGKKGLQIASSQAKYMDLDSRLTDSHIHGWTNIQDENDKDFPFSPNNLETIINKFGKTPLPVETVKDLRAYIDSRDDYNDREVDITPTTLYTWIAFVQRDRGLFDLGMENLVSTAPGLQNTTPIGKAGSRNTEKA